MYLLYKSIFDILRDIFIFIFVHLSIIILFEYFSRKVFQSCKRSNFKYKNVNHEFVLKCLLMTCKYTKIHRMPIEELRNEIRAMS